MNYRRWMCLLLSTVLLVSLLPLGAQAAEEPPTVNATSVIVTDAYTGKVIYENNADEERAIASVTKIMTGYLACEGLSLDDERLDEVFTVSKHAADSDKDGTSLYLLADQQVTYEELLYGTMLRSGNDAAVALAEAICDGDEDAFIERMNEKAQELGMEHTHYSNSNGLIDEDNYSTARDLAILAREAMQNELFAKVVGTWYIELGPFQIENHNQLLQSMKGECLGIKTGFTTLAGSTFVSCAERDGSRFIVVTLNDNYQFDEHEALYEWAFKNYPANVLCSEGNTVTTLRIGTTEVPLIASETLVAASAGDGEVVECQIRLPSRVSGAITQGSVAGTATYTLNGEVLGTVDLLYSTFVVN